MIHRAVTAAILMAAASSPVFAQGITGGELGIEYNAPTNGSDFGGTTYSGGFEYGFLDTFSVSADVATYKFDNVGTDANNITLHGSYFLSPTTAIGGFFAHDSIEDADRNLYGLEGRTSYMGGDVGAYIGQADGDGDTGTIFGVDGSYALRSGFSVIANVDLFDSDIGTISQVSAGAEYQMQVGPQFYAQIGNVTGDLHGNDDSYGFFTVGAKVAFGASGGTTFTNRSVLEVVPGF